MMMMTKIWDDLPPHTEFKLASNNNRVIIILLLLYYYYNYLFITKIVVVGSIIDTYRYVYYN
jgi:hypothetical protein